MGYTFALVGNPNCGKTTLFNRLTGSAQYVGNWAGVTVEKKTGRVRLHEQEIDVVDLPGIYSLSPYTPEEVVARKYIINDKPDLIIDIVDATNIERNLYLTTQLSEFGRPMIVVLNMMDALTKSGVTVDIPALEKELGVPVIPVSASHGTGIHELLHAAVNAAEEGKLYHERHHLADLNDATAPEDEHNHPHPLPTPHGTYTPGVERAIDRIERVIARRVDVLDISRRFCAVKLFEGDELTEEMLDLKSDELNAIHEAVEEVEHDVHLDHETIIADLRYRYICGLCDRVLNKTKQKPVSLTDRIDAVVTNRYASIPIFLVIMAAIFFVTFGPPGQALSNLVEQGITLLSDWVSGLLVSGGASDWSRSLVTEGVIGGLGAIVSFFPQILVLFFFLSILEDSGYMARAAFIMDGLLGKIGLNGKAFVPMLMGFGCSVPAVMGTRTLEDKRDRTLTMFLIPFMSCGAKMPVYALIIGTFFAAQSGIAVGALYFLGIAVAILCAVILNKGILRKKEPSPFVMELPPYRLPMPRSIAIRLGDRIKDFLSRAVTVLLGASVVIWFLRYFNYTLNPAADVSDSILASVGQWIAPIFSPLGFGIWPAAVALICGLLAKESVVSTLAVIYGAETGAALTAAVTGVLTPQSALSFCVFVLLYAPCVATFSAMKKELGGTWKALGIVTAQTCVAWLVSFLVYTIAGLF